MQCWIELKICNIQLFSFSIRLLKNLYLYIGNMLNQIFYFVDLNGLNDPLHGKTAVERRATMQNAASYMPANLNQQLCNFFWEVTKWNKWTLTSDVYWLKFRPLKKKLGNSTVHSTQTSREPSAVCRHHDIPQIICFANHKDWSRTITCKYSFFFIFRATVQV